MRKMHRSLPENLHAAQQPGGFPLKAVRSHASYSTAAAACSNPVSAGHRSAHVRHAFRPFRLTHLRCIASCLTFRWTIGVGILQCHANDKCAAWKDPAAIALIGHACTSWSLCEYAQGQPRVAEGELGRSTILHLGAPLLGEVRHCGAAWIWQV